MMARIFLFAGMLIGMSNFAAASQLLNEVYLNGQGNGAMTVIPLADGYFISGGGFDVSTGFYELKFIKIDLSGDTLWEKHYGKLGFAYRPGFAGSTKHLAKGGYLVCGTVQDTALVSWPGAFLLKLTETGDTVWTKTFAAGRFQLFRDCIETPENDIVAVGEFGATSLDYGNVYVIKVDSSGNTKWSQVFGDSLEDIGEHIEIIAGDYVISGLANSSTLGIGDNLVVKLDTNGSRKWYKLLTTSHNNASCLLRQSFEGGYFIFGGKVANTVYLEETDTALNVNKSYFFDANNYSQICGIKQLQDGGFVVYGSKDNPLGSHFPTGFIELWDSSYNILWTRLYNYSVEDSDYGLGTFNDLQPLTGGFVLTGRITYFDSTSELGQFQKAWVVTTDTNGCLNSYCGLTGMAETFAEISFLSIYPNPTTSKITIKYPLQGAEASWSVYDIMGKQIASGQHQGTDPLQLDVTSYPKGMYIARIIAGSHSYIGKFVVE